MTTRLIIDVTEPNELDQGVNEMFGDPKEVDEKENTGARNSSVQELLLHDNSNGIHCQSNNLVTGRTCSGKAVSPVDRAMSKIAAAYAVSSSWKYKHNDEVNDPLTPVRRNLINLAINGKKKQLAVLSESASNLPRQEESEILQKKLVENMKKSRMSSATLSNDDEDNIDNENANCTNIDETNMSTSYHPDSTRITTATDVITNVKNEKGKENECSDATISIKQQQAENKISNDNTIFETLGKTIWSAINQNPLKIPSKKNITTEDEGKNKTEKLKQIINYFVEDSGTFIGRNELAEEFHNLTVLSKDVNADENKRSAETEKHQMIIDDIVEESGNSLDQNELAEEVQHEGIDHKEPPQVLGNTTGNGNEQNQMLHIQKYWQTLLAPSELQKIETCEVQNSEAGASQPLIKEELRGEKELTPIMTQEKKEKIIKRKCNKEVYSPQSTVSILDDYSLAGTDIEEGDDASASITNYNMLVTATAAQTPIINRSKALNHTESIVSDSPAVSDFNNMLQTATASDTPNVVVETKKNGNGDCFRCQQENYYRPSINTPSEIDLTPIKSNKTDLERTSTSSLLSNCDESEAGSIYTTISLQSSIQSNTPRNRRKGMEWVGPNPSNTGSWKIHSMATKVKSTETPERDISVVQISSKSVDGRRHLISHQQTSKSSQWIDWLVPKRNNRGCGTLSPTSLPSILGNTSVNEVSDLESPNVVISAFNFKFSDEESTIQSQSIHEASEIDSLPGNEAHLRIESPQSLMTVATPVVTYPTSEESSLLKSSNAFNSSIPRSHPTPSTASISMPASVHGDTRTNSTKHLMITQQPFQQGYNDLYFKSPMFLKRCVMFGILVAIIGLITVVALIFTDKNNDGKIISNPNTKTDWMDINDIDVELPTISPTRAQFSSESGSPTIVSSFIGGRGERNSTSEPVSHSTINSIQQDEIPIPLIPLAPQEAVELVPTISPSSSETKIYSTVEPTSVSTLEASFKASFSEEERQQLTWNRIINGDDIWRPSDGEVVPNPLWFFANDNSGIHLKVINAVKGQSFIPKINTVIEDYSQSKAVSSLDLTTVPYEVLCPPPNIGQVKVCSGDFGGTDWLGSTVLFMRNEFIVSALIRINESSTLSSADDGLSLYALCHQFGHVLGLSHNTADVTSLSCMQDLDKSVFVDGNSIWINEKVQHPNSADLDALVKLYGSSSITKRLGDTGNI